MTCLETQSKIVAFIEDKLPDEEVVGFIKHIRNCENCSEELEIYYTMLVGMKQLDNEEPLSADFRKDLDDKLNHAYYRIVNTKKLKLSSLVLLFGGVLAVGIILYSNFLNLLYISEQKQIKDNQPEYMYYEYFGDYVCNEDTFYLLKPYKDKTNEDAGLDFYKKIRSIKLTEEYNENVNNDESKNLDEKKSDDTGE